MDFQPFLSLISGREVGLIQSESSKVHCGLYQSGCWYPNTVAESFCPPLVLKKKEEKEEKKKSLIYFFYLLLFLGFYFLGPAFFQSPEGKKKTYGRV